MKFLGKFDCSIEFQLKVQEGKCFVSNNNNNNLLGIDFIDKFGLWDKPINSVCLAIKSKDRSEIITGLKSKFPLVFSNRLGKCIKKVCVNPQATPTFCPRRPVAFAMIEKVDAELNRLKNEGIITPIEYSAWAAPIVCVRKSNGQIRICADYSTGFNDS
jgi:hypothetical protein